MSADWSLPLLTSAYAATWHPTILARDVDAITLQIAAITNPPTGAFRYVRASDKFQEWSGAAYVDKVLSIAGGGTGGATAAAARTALGLGDMATQTSSAVAISGGTIAGDGSGLTNLNAANLASNVVPAARLAGANSYIFTSATVASSELKAYFETLVASAIAAGAITFNLVNGNHFGPISLNANVTVSISGSPAANKVGVFTTVWKADGTLRTITWPASVVWSSGAAPVMTSTVNKLDILTFITYDAGVKWIGSVYAQNQ